MNPAILAPIPESKAAEKMTSRDKKPNVYMFVVDAGARLWISDIDETTVEARNVACRLY